MTGDVRTVSLAGDARQRLTSVVPLCSLRRAQANSEFGWWRLPVGRKKATPKKVAAASGAAPKKKPTVGRGKPALAENELPARLIPEGELAAHFPAVEAAVREGQLNVRAGLLDDPRQRTTVLVHLLLEYCGDRLAGRPPESVFWTRWYWHHRLCRMHERLEHGGKRCDAEREREDRLVEESCESDVDWDVMKQVEARAEADAYAALGPGPFKRPAFACGDVRPLKHGDKKRRPRGGG